MSFTERLAVLPKERGFTRQHMADKMGRHVSQLKRYESGASQPTIEVVWTIALALNLCADRLLYEADERGPDERLKLQFEAVSKRDEKEREAVETMFAGVLHRHGAKRRTQAVSAPAAPATKPAPAKKSAAGKRKTHTALQR